VDGDLKSGRLTSHGRDSTSDDADQEMTCHSRRRRRHRHGDGPPASECLTTRQERARLGLRDKLDELRLHDAAELRHSHSVTSSPPPGLVVTSCCKEVETGGVEHVTKSSSVDADVKLDSLTPTRLIDDTLSTRPQLSTLGSSHTAPLLELVSSVSRNRDQISFNPLTPTVAIWVQLYKSILCQTGLSRHL